MKKVLLLFIDLMSERGIQEYDRYLCDALAAGFPDMHFTGLSIKNVPDPSMGSRWPGMNIMCYGRVRPPLAARLIFAPVLL